MQRPRAFHLVALAFFSIAGLQACGGDDDDSSSAPMTVESYYTAYYEQGCAEAFACCTGASGDFSSNIANTWEDGLTSASQCKGHALPDYFKKNLEAYQASIKDGLTKFHGEKAAACLAARASLSCELMFNERVGSTPKACEGLFEGTRSIGDACELSHECPIGAGCIGNTNNGYFCKAIPDRGEPCSSYCPGELHCGSSGTCEDPLPEGTPCDPITDVFACAGTCDYNTNVCGPAYAPSCVP